MIKDQLTLISFLLKKSMGAQDILSRSAQEPVFERKRVQTGTDSLFQSLLWLAQHLPTSPSNRRLFQTMVFPLLLCLQACSIMYQPRFDEESGFREPESPLDREEIQRRRNQMTQILVAPIDPSNLARTTGITYDQLSRILEHSEELFSDTHEEDFQQYMHLCRRARDELGVSSPDRFPPQTLREVLANHEDVERHRERPVALVFLARQDHTYLGIQALNVQSHLVEGLLDRYKVLLYETNSMTEILFQMNRLIQGGFLPPGKLKGLVFGAHGNEFSNQAGIDFKNLHSLSILSECLAPDAQVVLSNCYSGEGENNLVARLTLLCENVWRKNVRVIGCTGRLVDFELDVSGQVEDDAVWLRSPEDLFTLGLLGSTLIGDREQTFRSRLGALPPDSHIPAAIMERNVRHGIVEPGLICKLYEAEVTPERFWEYSTQLAQLGISLPPLMMVECMKANIDPGMVHSYAQSLGGLRRISQIRGSEEITQYAIRLGKEGMERQIALQQLMAAQSR